MKRQARINAQTEAGAYLHTPVETLKLNVENGVFDNSFRQPKVNMDRPVRPDMPSADASAAEFLTYAQKLQAYEQGMIAYNSALADYRIHAEAYDKESYRLFDVFKQACIEVFFKGEFNDGFTRMKQHFFSLCYDQAGDYPTKIDIIESLERSAPTLWAMLCSDIKKYLDKVEADRIAETDKAETE